VTGAAVVALAVTGAEGTRNRAAVKLCARARARGGAGWCRGRPMVGNLRWRHASAGEESWLLPEAVPEDTPEVRELNVEAALELKT
jgi:hypothetical protein